MNLVTPQPPHATPSTLILGTQEIAAVKVLRLTGAPNELAEMEAEIAILRDNTHGNLVHLYGTYLRNGKLWVVMEYCGGGSLQTLYSRLGAPLNEDQIKFVMQEALSGLAYMHRCENGFDAGWLCHDVGLDLLTRHGDDNGRLAADRFVSSVSSTPFPRSFLGVHLAAAPARSTATSRVATFW